MSQPSPSSPALEASRQRALGSVSSKLIAFVFAATSLTALIVSWISIQSTHTHLRRQVEDRLPAILDSTALRLEDWLEEARREAAQARGRPVEALERTRRLEALARLDSSGSGIQWAGPWPTPPPPAEGPETEWIAGPEGEARLLLRQETPRGRILALARSEPLIALLRQSARPGMGSLSVVDGSGTTLLAASREGAPARPPAWLPAPARRSESRVFELTLPSGEHLVASARPLPVLGGSLVVDEPFEVAFRPLLELVSWIFLCDLAIIVGLSLLAYRVATRMMEPIQALSQGALRISRGELDVEIPDPRSHDEIGLLTRTFNDMMRQLRRDQEEIEQANGRLTRQYEELLRANEILAQLSITDGLTKLHNHRYFQDQLNREIKRASRTGEPLSMLLLDLDDFKQLNDRLGHAAGDELLVKISRVMVEAVRTSDLVARYGGEEFVVLAPETDLAGAVSLGEKVRMAICDTPHIVDDSLRPVRATVSVGVARFSGDRRGFFQEADRALYRAKAAGKNCVMAADSDDLA